jgi:signal transduction histidine kinase
MAPGSDSRIRRRSVDAVQLIRQVADVVRPPAPEELPIDIESNGTAMGLADPGDVFRILFNLVNNAVAVARETGQLTRIEASVVRRGPTVAIRLADDGPGLPAAVRSNLFRSPEDSRGGHGLVIARELAERNGGTLSLDPTAEGAAFVLTLPAFVALLVESGPVTRSLGQGVAPTLGTIAGRG